MLRETAARDGTGAGGPVLGRRGTWQGLAALSALGLARCSAEFPPSPVTAPMLATAAGEDWWTLPDGTRLPLRQFLPRGAPWAVTLALHGFNDSSDGWDLPASAMARAGVAVLAPDQRGFGLSAARGQWPGTRQLVADAAAMARLTAARFPGLPLFLMGESMGSAVLMVLAAQPDAPPVAGYVLCAPAVWGWSEMAFYLRGTLWLANGLVPGLTLGTGPVRVRASDNNAALRALAEDPRTILRTRVAAVAGLVDLMQQALRAARMMRVRALFMYGGHDQLVPAHAMRAAWRAAEADPRARFAFYPDGYHLLLRDLERGPRIEDILAWMRHPDRPLPSGATREARAFMAGARFAMGLSLDAKSV